MEAKIAISTKAKNRTSIYLDILMIIVGTVIFAVSFNMLTRPAGLLSGGLTGISQFINHFFLINVGLFYFILNVPLLILGYKYLDWSVPSGLVIKSFIKALGWLKNSKRYFCICILPG